MKYKMMILGLLFATLVIVVYIIFIAGKIAFPKDPLLLLIALLVYMIGWIISALRLRHLHVILDGEDKRLRLIDYLKARLLGGFLAYVTPFALGGEPARAYYLSFKTGGKVSKYLSLTLIEAYYDVMIVNITAIGLSIYALPLTIPVIIVALASISYWLLFYYILRNLIDPDKLVYPINKLVNYLSNKIRKYGEGYDKFAYSFRSIVDKLSFTSKLFLAVSTLIYQLFFALTIYFVYLSYKDPVELLDYKILVYGLIQCITAYFYSNSLAALPTPGGAISAEYGLSITLPPEAVVLSRIILYYTPIILGIYIIHKEKILEDIVKRIQQK